MFERFDQNAIKTIMLAQEEARRLGHNFVGTEQMLLGLIGGRGKAHDVLDNFGVKLKTARVETEKIIGRGSGFVAVEIPFTPNAKKALEASWEAARSMESKVIGTEHLLCGIIAGRDGVGLKVLENLGVPLSDLALALRSPLPVSKGNLTEDVKDYKMKELRRLETQLQEWRDLAEEAERSGEQSVLSDVQAQVERVSEYISRLRKEIEKS